MTSNSSWGRRLKVISRFGGLNVVKLTFRNGSELRLHKRQVEVTLSRRQGAALRVTAQPDACVQNDGRAVLIDYAAAREATICICPSRGWE